MTYHAHDDQSLAFDTLQLHAGYEPACHNGSKAVPVYQTSAFELGDFDRCVRLFDYEEEGHSYVCFSNPTNDVLEKRMAAPAEEQRKAGVFEDTLRISVGTEDAGDLVQDLAQALES